MKRISILAAIAGMFAFCSCGVLETLGTATEDTTTSTASTTNTTTTNSSNNGGTLGNILGSILGSMTKSTTENTIIGTWTYQEPSVQFSSDNLLAQAGGTVASSTVVSKIQPYYEKVGIKPGNLSITLNEDKTCSYTFKKKTYTGTYTFDQSNGTIAIKGTALSFPTAYVTVSGSQMSLTFDSSKILSLIQSMGSLTSGNSTLSSISTIAQQFDGMKTGFLMTK